MSLNQLARALRVPTNRVRANGKRAITVNTAMRLADFEIADRKPN